VCDVVGRRRGKERKGRDGRGEESIYVYVGVYDIFKVSFHEIVPRYEW